MKLTKMEKVNLVISLLISETFTFIWIRELMGIMGIVIWSIGTIGGFLTARKVVKG